MGGGSTPRNSDFCSILLEFQLGSFLEFLGLEMCLRISDFQANNSNFTLNWPCMGMGAERCRMMTHDLTAHMMKRKHGPTI